MTDPSHYPNFFGSTKEDVNTTSPVVSFYGAAKQSVNPSEFEEIWLIRREYTLDGVTTKEHASNDYDRKWSERTAQFPPFLSKVESGDTKNLITFESVLGATSYNLYWSLAENVSENDNKITGVTSVFNHTGLTNGVEYFYRVTAIVNGVESGLSNELSQTPTEFFNLKSVLLDGVDEYINIGDVADFERTDSFSVSAWVKISVTSLAMFVTRLQSASPNRGWQLYKKVNEGKMVLDLANDFGTSNVLRVRTVADINDGLWQHIVVTYDGSSNASGVKFYIAGVSAAVVEELDALTATIVPTGVNLNIGAREGAIFWEGNIDEVAIYDKELSASEVSDIYNSGSATNLAQLSSSPNLYSWHRFTQTDIDNFPSIADHSVNGRGGTAISMESTDIVTDVP